MRASVIDGGVQCGRKLGMGGSLVEIVRGNPQRQQRLIAECGLVPLTGVQLRCVSVPGRISWGEGNKRGREPGKRIECSYVEQCRLRPRDDRVNEAKESTIRLCAPEFQSPGLEQPDGGLVEFGKGTRGNGPVV